MTKVFTIKVTLERIPEDAFVEWVQEQPFPCIALKLVMLGLRGWPDRTILGKGRMFFIEFKRDGNKSSKLRSQQRTWKKRLEILGFKVYVCTTKDQAIAAFQRHMDTP